MPVTVLGGYLGAGKTTLVNHLLRNADGKRLAILVNDFGDIAIDEDLIEAEEDETNDSCQTTPNDQADLPNLPRVASVSRPISPFQEKEC